MDFTLRPWQLYLVILAGWINRQQQEVIEYLLAENQVLKEELGKKRILLSDDQRRRLAVSPNESWMKQVARELTNCEDGFLLDKKQVLMDRDGKFSPAFRDFLDNEGAKPLRLPARSPNLNAHLERFMKSIKSESLHKMIFFGETSLRRAVISYLEHYHAERNHQGLGNQILEPGGEVARVDGPIDCRERLGGLLRYYHRHAA